eukprot:scaffold91968_cov60-Phaeocystis_antarctica.AAC.2
MPAPVPISCFQPGPFQADVSAKAVVGLFARTRAIPKLVPDSLSPMTSMDAARDRKGPVEVLAAPALRSCSCSSCFADKSPCSRSQASVAISGHVVGVHCSSKVGEYHEAFGGPGWPGSSAPLLPIASARKGQPTETYTKYNLHTSRPPKIPPIAERCPVACPLLAAPQCIREPGAVLPAELAGVGVC